MYILFKKFANIEIFLKDYIDSFVLYFFLQMYIYKLVLNVNIEVWFINCNFNQ